MLPIWSVFFVIFRNTQSNTQWQLCSFLHVTEKIWASLQLTSPRHTNKKRKSKEQFICTGEVNEKIPPVKRSMGLKYRDFWLLIDFLHQGTICSIEYKGSHISIEDRKKSISQNYLNRMREEKNAGNFRFHGLWCNFNGYGLKKKCFSIGYQNYVTFYTEQSWEIFS